MPLAQATFQPPRRLKKGAAGYFAGSNGTVNVSGGNWTNSSSLTIGNAGNGTLNLTGNGIVSVGGGLVTLANTSGIIGTLNLGNGTTAGTLSASTITGGSGTAVVKINQSGSYTLGSNMTGSLAFNHIGTGTTTLTDTNTYSGNTTVSAGKLNMNGSTSASSRFTVASGATLGGYGDVDWADSFWTADQSWVIYDVTGTTTGANNLSIATAAWLDQSSNSFDSILSGSSFSLGLQGNDLVLNYRVGTSSVPEPSQVAASLLLLSGLGIYLWRRKNAAPVSHLRS